MLNFEGQVPDTGVGQARDLCVLCQLFGFLPEVGVLILTLATVLVVLLEVFLSLTLIGQPRPSLLLLLTIAAGMVRSAAAGIMVAFFGGLLLDALAGPPLGRQALALVIASLLIFLKHSDLARTTVLAPPLAVVAGTLLYWLVLGLTDAGLGLAVPWMALSYRWILPILLMNGLLTLPTFYLLERLSIRRTSRSVRRT